MTSPLFYTVAELIEQLKTLPPNAIVLGAEDSGEIYRLAKEDGIEQRFSQAIYLFGDLIEYCNSVHVPHKTNVLLPDVPLVILSLNRTD